ncbi:MAG: serine/threonine protein kinase [Myxococcales bacterium]|nr:serine/threonine protein kinase [Myxococcales bacterium]
MNDQGVDSRVFGDKFLVVEQVGSGGMATVYLGRDTELDRDVAIKVLHPHLASRADARARFSREAKSIARLHHPNIVDVYTYSGGNDADAYLVTEFVNGITLTEFCDAHGPFLPQAAALIAHAIAGALKHAHSHGLVHRDIKPDNLMISRDGTIKLMDFGIATAVDLEQMTATGTILGSPAHMAPEQIEGRGADFRVDIFAFGTLLYKLVTGELPFMASNPHALFRLILECEYEPPSRYSGAIGRRFEEIIDTCMAREPKDRFSSMAAVQDTLETYLHQFDMNDVATLVPRLLTAPEQFQLEWRPLLVRSLCAEGRRQAREGSLALAISAYNRALAIDPDALDPRRGLSDLTSRSRRHKRLKHVAILSSVAAVVAGVWLGVGSTPPPPRTEATAPLPTDAIKAATLPSAPDELAMIPKAKAAPKKVAAASPTPTRTAGTAAAAPTAPDPIKRAEPVDVAAKTPDSRAALPVVKKKVRGARRHPRPNRRPAPTSVGGSKQVATPEPKGLVVFTLASLPPSATLYLDGKLITKNGVKRLPLETGRSYTMRCLPTSVCDECPEFKDVRFQVPEDPTKLLKKRVLCDFRECCARSTRPAIP